MMLLSEIFGEVDSGHYKTTNIGIFRKESTALTHLLFL